MFSTKPFSILLLLISVIVNSVAGYAQVPDSVKDNSFVVSKIRIIGNNKTKDYVILNELTFSVGDTIDNKILEYNRERIYGLKIFNFVDILTDNAPQFKKVIIVVKETWTIFPTPYLNYRKNSIKYSQYGINFLYKNFRGRNETIMANLGFGFDPNIYLQYFNPNFFKPNLIFSMQVGYSNFFNKSKRFLRISKEDFNYKSFYAGFTLGKRYNLYHRIEVGYLYRYIFIDKPYSSQYLNSKCDEEYEPTLSISYQFDTRNLVLRSTLGTYLKISLMHYGFYLSPIHFVSITSDFRKYFPLNSLFNFKFRVLNRYLIGDKIPIYEHSFLGYDDYVRGYSHSVREGKNKFLLSSEISLPIVKEYNLELNLPLLPTSLTSARIGLDLSAFVDVANVYDDISSLKLHNDNMVGYGVSLNFLILPFNALRFECAFDKKGKMEFIFESGFSF